MAWHMVLFLLNTALEQSSPHAKKPSAKLRDAEDKRGQPQQGIVGNRFAAVGPSHFRQSRPTSRPPANPQKDETPKPALKQKVRYENVLPRAAVSPFSYDPLRVSKGVDRQRSDGSSRKHRGNTRDAVAVVVAGQLQRFELRSKVLNLARPTEAAGVDVDFFLVLSETNNTVYSRTDAGSSDKAVGRQCSAKLDRLISTNDTCAVDSSGNASYWCYDEHIHVKEGCSGSFSCIMADGSTLPNIRCPPVGSKRLASACSCSGRKSTPPRLDCVVWSSRDELYREMSRLNASLVAAEWPTRGAWASMATPIKTWLSTPSSRNTNPVGDDKKISLGDFRGGQYDAAYKLGRAALLIEQREIRMGKLYDTILLLRDDSVITQPWRVPTPPLSNPWLPPISKTWLRTVTSKQKPPRKNFFPVDLELRRQWWKVHLHEFPQIMARGKVPGCHVKDCFDWNGVANKVFVCSRHHMHALLRSAFGDIAFGEPYVPFHGHSEAWIKRIFDEYAVPLEPMQPEDLPVVVARPPCACGSSTSVRKEAPWCLISDKSRDCHPSGLPTDSPMFNSTALVY